MRPVWLLIIAMASAPLLALAGNAVLPQAPLGLENSAATNAAPQRLLVLFPPHLDSTAAMARIASHGRPLAEGRAGSWLVAGGNGLAAALYRNGAWLVLDAESWLAGCFTRSS